MTERPTCPHCRRTLALEAIEFHFDVSKECTQSGGPICRAIRDTFLDVMRVTIESAKLLARTKIVPLHPQGSGFSVVIDWSDVDAVLVQVDADTKLPDPT